MANPHVGDIGAVLKATSSKNLSTQTALRLYYRKPGGTTGYFTAALSGTTDVQYTTTAASDLDEAGVWEFQGYAVITGWTGRSSKFSVQVDRAIT